MVELSREIPSAMLARLASWLRELSEPFRLRPLFSLALMTSESPLRLRCRRCGARLSSVNDHACDEYIKTLPRKRVAAGVLLRDENNRIVLIEPSYKETWEIPGGVVEAGESPWLAAERELKEELGLVRRNMPALVVDHVPVAPDGMPEGLLWIFDGGLLSDTERAELRGTDEEVKSVHLLPIDEAVERTKESLARRLRVALNAVLTQETVLAQETIYCDRGEPRPDTRMVTVPATRDVRTAAPVP